MILVDAAPAYDLGTVGELDLLLAFDGTVTVPRAVIDAVDVEPAATNLDRFVDEHGIDTDPPTAGFEDDAAALLGDGRPSSDRALVAALLAARADAAASDTVGVVSDDRRLRAIADGLGATVTGTFGVVVRAAVDDKYFSTSQAKRVVRRLDQHGLQSTGPLRARAVGAVGSDE